MARFTNHDAARLSWVGANSIRLALSLGLRPPQDPRGGRSAIRRCRWTLKAPGISRQRQMNWDRNLSRPITLSDGRKLRTLHDAVECLIATFDGISHWPALKHASDLLMTAAETGKRKDVTAATNQVVVVLSQRGLM